jgi:t-SNARE complex subunit (syntaxin)
MISDAENAALQRQLLNTSSDVARLERGMRDVATLNQMFSTQVVQQSEQIEHIYAQVRPCHLLLMRILGVAVVSWQCCSIIKAN